VDGDYSFCRVFSHFGSFTDRNDKGATGDPQVDEFNVACLKTLVKMLDKFQLRCTDTLNTGDDTIHVISREFNKYSHMLLQFLEMYQPDYSVRIDALIRWVSDFSLIACRVGR